MDNALLYKDKPIFGLDIGFSSLKVMQIEHHARKRRVTGYGVANFDPSAVKDSVIQDPEAIAKVAQHLFKHSLVGDITTRQVCLAIPASKAFSRSMQIPKLAKKELFEAVRLEAEQYIPRPLDSLYLDYEVVNETADTTELLVVAVAREIVDSYLLLARLLGLEVVGIETTIGAGSRLFLETEFNEVPTVLVDFGSVSSDITVFDNGLIVTGTVPGGGDSFTNIISETLKVTKQEAHVIKTKYGLGVSKKQKVITDGLKPLLDQLVKEIRRNVRYYEERSVTDKKIGQVVTMGGGANMPGLSDYLTDQLRLPVRTCDPWDKLDFAGLQPLNPIEKSMFITVSGLALLQPKELFA